MNVDEKKLSSKELARKASREIHRAQNDMSGHVSMIGKHENLFLTLLSKNCIFKIFLFRGTGYENTWPQNSS